PIVPDASRGHLRDRVREIIRNEVERHHPTEDARHPLELIVESSVRYAENSDGIEMTVVDKAGRVRTKTVGGQIVPFTIEDFLEELRNPRPMPSRSAPTPADPGSAITPPAKQDQAHGPKKRDWLDVGSEPTTPHRKRSPLSARNRL